jgi:repressor LexA
MANNRELGKKQKEIYECIKRWLLTKGYPPTVREICTEVDLKSTASVYFHLNSLEMKGYIRRDPDKPRTIEVLDDEFRDLWISSLGTRNAPKKDSSGSSHSSHAPSVGSEVVQVPIVGRVAAGTPLLAVEQVDSYFPVPVDRLPKEQCFILKVRGDSMVNAGIFNGDYVLVEKTKEASNGDIVVALIEDSATVKTFYREADCIRLQPENDAMEPIIVRDQLEILGKVFGVIRFF